MNESRAKWDKIYAGREAVWPEPNPVLAENQHLLPAGGVALDLACGMGGNALFLARQGLESHAWDVSAVAIERVQHLADEKGLDLTGEVRDITSKPPAADSFDVIVVCHFLERSIMPQLIAALRPGGVFFYQTFTRHRVAGRGPGNDAYRLEANELLRIFSDFHVLFYREECDTGDLSAGGLRDEAMIVAMKR